MLSFHVSCDVTKKLRPISTPNLRDFLNSFDGIVRCGVIGHLGGAFRDRGGG